MKKKKIVQPTLGILLLLAFYFITRDESIQKWFSNNACVSLRKSITTIEIAGIVSTKYLDVNSHMHETIIIENNGVNLKVIIPNEYSGLYHFLQRGDSIFKEEKSLRCKVNRAGNINEFLIDFKCN